MGGPNDIERSLRLRRETLRELGPSETGAAAVRGGDTSMCSLKRDMCEFVPAEKLLPPMTHYSWGCRGRITVTYRPDEGVVEYDFALGPPPELVEFANKLTEMKRPLDPGV